MTLLDDPAMWEMFRAEVDTHMAALNDGLLALERDPGQSLHFEPLMRAAHSIKGAAKIMGVHGAVQIAHLIENCFVAAREKHLTVTGPLIDVLLDGVDLLGSVAQCDVPKPDEATSARVREVLDRIQNAVTQGEQHGGHVEAQQPNPSRSRRADTHSGLALGRSLNEAWIRANHTQVLTAVRAASSSLHLNCSEVEAIDAYGLAWLTLLGRDAVERTETSPLTIYLDDVALDLTRLLRITGVDRVCHVSVQER